MTPVWQQTAMAAFVAFGASALLTGVVRATVARSMLNHPNERSSHSSVVPQGGGIALVIVVLAAVAWGALSRWLLPSVAIALLGGGASIALIGWLDDRSPRSTRLRLGVQLAAAVWTVAWMGGFPALDIGAHRIELGLVGSVLAVLAIVWSINLFNFMDGIDGIAGTEALAVGAFGGALLVHAAAPGLGLVAIVTGAAALGFLCWNWHPARIFMGDVGSTFLGYLFGAIAVASENAQAVPALVWVILASVFVGDATITLVRRIGRGYWSEAHRTHAYQRAVQAGSSHARVAAAVGATNLILGLIAILVTRRPPLLLSGVVVAILVVGTLYALVGRRVPYPDLPRRQRN